MLEGRRLLAIVPARGGSKGVPLKNVRPLLGRPLIAHTAEVVRSLPYLDRAIVSTDHPEIQRVASEVGLEGPFVRPPELSGDLVSDLAVLTHGLQECERLAGVTYDVVIMLQPTSPLRRPQHVDEAVRKLIREDWDAVWTVSPTDVKYHPLKQLCLGPEGAMSYFDPRGGNVIARQQLDPIYHRNGAAYVFTRQCLLEQRTTVGRRTAAVVIQEPMPSIDTVRDFEVAERHLRERSEG